MGLNTLERLSRNVDRVSVYDGQGKIDFSISPKLNLQDFLGDLTLEQIQENLRDLHNLEEQAI